MVSKKQSSLLFDWCVMHLFRCVQISFVCAARHRYCDPLCNVPASALKLDSIFAASLRSNFAAFLLHVLGAVFAFASLAACLPHLWLQPWLQLLLLECFALSRVPSFHRIGRSWQRLAAGHSWFHRVPQAPHFPKCPSSKTSQLVNILCSPKTRYF